MNIYADTSFVVSLYKAEASSIRAAGVMKSLEPPVLLSPVGELELCNAFQLSVFRGEISREAAAVKKRLFLGDVASGVFSIQRIPSMGLYSRALDLADRHSGVFGTRSLDLLHVAAALLLRAELFLSFDERQCRVANVEGLAVCS